MGAEGRWHASRACLPSRCECPGGGAREHLVDVLGRSGKMGHALLLPFCPRRHHSCPPTLQLECAVAVRAVFCCPCLASVRPRKCSASCDTAGWLDLWPCSEGVFLFQKGQSSALSFVFGAAHIIH